MDTSGKQPPQSAGKKSGWGSMFSNAVAGLESRLDTILAEDGEASARARAAEHALQEAKIATSRSSEVDNPNDPSRLNVVKTSAAPSRDASRNRTNERLAEKLAKATARKSAGSDAGSTVGSEPPSRVATPALKEQDRSPRLGEERMKRNELPTTFQNEDPGSNGQAASVQVNVPRETASEDIGDSGRSNTDLPPRQQSRLSIESMPPADDYETSRLSLDQNSQSLSSRPSLEIDNGESSISAIELEEQLVQIRKDNETAEKERQEEMHGYLERIDGLQAKLQYLARETVAAAQESNASALPSSSPASRLAEKDERIALLMEEGEKLSKIELRHTQTIKQLRSKQAEHDKASAGLKQRLARVEASEKELRTKLLRAERAERIANERVKQIDKITRQVDELQADRERASDLIRKLTTQLKTSEKASAEARREANIKATEVDKQKTAALETELEDARIERKLADDRAAAQAKRAEDDARRQTERFSATELELKAEISTLESRLEALRSRAEEAGMDGNASGENNIKLLRQVETLQSQYTLAKANWETIEGSLNARLAVVERERDEVSRKEVELRKKARDLGASKRKLEHDSESHTDQMGILNKELDTWKEHSSGLEARLKNMEISLADAHRRNQQQRKAWDQDLTAKVEEEKSKWQRNLGNLSSSAESPFANNRRTSTADVFSYGQNSRSRQRLASHELSSINVSDHSMSFRSSTLATPTYRFSPNQHASRTPERDFSAVISRQQSAASLDPNNIPPTPNAELEEDEVFDRHSSPQRTINDLVSTSNAASGAGPSVQLVERMSAAVRRLEAEKASHKDEVMRLTSQRDDARNEVVAMMRDMEGKTHDTKDLSKTEDELGEMTRRYETALEVLGEKEEQVEELKADVIELKRIYRDLVEEKVGRDLKT